MKQFQAPKILWIKIGGKEIGLKLKNRPKRQTYLEYVKERRRVEEELR